MTGEDLNETVFSILLEKNPTSSFCEWMYPLMNIIFALNKDF